MLISNYTNTYALFLYNETLWNRDSQSIVVGYTAGNYQNYLNVELENTSSSLLRMAEEVGNSGRPGEWVFDLTPAENMVSGGEQSCLQWAEEQEERGMWYTDLPACPCTHQQAVQDRRYSFVWGTRETCAVFVQGGRMSTTECCYDESTGALLVGAPNGGGYRFFNPITSRQKFEEEDTITPKEYCCKQSNLCELYYKYRPPDNCGRYLPTRTGGFTAVY